MISVNETGFLPGTVKLAISDMPGDFYIIDDSDGNRVEAGVTVTGAGRDETVGEEVYRLDFSDVNIPGVYHIESDKGERSVSFKVEQHVYKSLKNSLLKYFYFQRCGCELQEKYAGLFKRPACHTSGVRLLGENNGISLSKGWHDAGDYGRYSSAGAVTVAHMLYAYELFPEAFIDPVNIPETGNGMPDILNECRYELDMLSGMQRADGGVYHKATSFVFCDYVMPDKDDMEMIMFPVTSMSTADFAAVMCIASRVYAEYDPDFARNCIHQAYMAGQWLIANPDNTDFHNPEGCNTGEYTDPSDIDERMWAFAELLRTDIDVRNGRDRSMMAAASQNETRQDRYLAHLLTEMDLYMEDHPHSDGRSIDDGFGWQDVSALAALAVIFDPDNRAGTELRENMIKMLCERAEAYVLLQKNGYPLAMQKQDFVWGSNMIVSNRANVLILACLALEQNINSYKKENRKDKIKAVELEYHDKEQKNTGMSEDELRSTKLTIKAFKEAALNQLHYILGMNALDLSYVTGFGEHAVKDPHNRVTVADKIDKPIPGELVGGPCILLADDEIKRYADKNTPAQKCYRDHYLSYSTNEIAIYWNSSLLFAVAYFDR